MLIAIAVMYGFCLLLAPFIAWVLYMAFDGDRRRASGELMWPIGEPLPADVRAQRTAAGMAAVTELERTPAPTRTPARATAV